MVKRTLVLAVTLALAFGFTAICFSGCANAQSIVYSVDHEWAQLFINQDGTVDLTYNITLTVSSGVVHGFYVGQPTGDFTPGEAVDQYGRSLGVADASSGSDHRVDVTMFQPLNAGNSIWFTVTTNVAGMMSNDTTNPGNYGMEFAPQWTPVPINDVRVQIVMPPGVTVNDLKTLPDKFWNSTSTVDGSLAAYWEIPVLQANQQYPIGVSFPAQYLPNYKPSSSSGLNIDAYLPLLIVLPILAILVIGGVVLLARKSTYASPRVSMESLGIRRGFTAVEASYLLALKPTQIVTEILYSLLKKRAVWAESTKPSLKLRVLSPYENKVGSAENPLRYYEIDFLHALKDDGTLDEEKLAQTVISLRETVEQKLRGYSRNETVDYYRKVVAQAWTQVEKAGTVELASNAYDEQLLWLMLDPDQRAKTETAFRDRMFQPNPLWFWWWYGYTTYHPNPTVKPNVNVPAQSAKPTAIPGADFANNIATSVEETSSNIVASLEKFASAIVPPPPKASHEPARHGADCVCACHACACACACVSCACACAGGGAH
jgi:hypothetical protein